MKFQRFITVLSLILTSLVSLGTARCDRQTLYFDMGAYEQGVEFARHGFLRDSSQACTRAPRVSNSNSTVSYRARVSCQIAFTAYSMGYRAAYEGQNVRYCDWVPDHIFESHRVLVLPLQTAQIVRTCQTGFTEANYRH